MVSKYKKTNQPVHHITIKRHHKWLIGSFTSLIIIFMVILSVFTYTIFVRMEVNQNSVNQRLDDLQGSFQSQINLLAEDVRNTQTNLEENQQTLSSLQASIGEDFSGVYTNAVDSVVIVSTDVGQGTGFIIDNEGYIVTNYHVIEGATAAGIYTNDDGPFDVELIGINSTIDVALLKIEGSFEELELGNSNNIQIGERVIAIGNPYGLQFSATSGSVSQVHRQGQNGFDAYVQIDAPINPGNSGGPLINKEGEVIGMVNFKIAGGAEGLGFALESNYIKQAINDISQQALNQTLI